MHRIALVIFSLGLPLSSQTAATTNQPERIGDGVKVLITVIYDSSYYKIIKAKPVSDSSTGENDEAIFKGHFTKLFETVQQYFHNRSVMVNISVGSVYQMDNISVPFEKSTSSIDGPETLKRLAEYGGSLGATNNTVFCLFSPKNIYEKSDRGDRMPRSLTELATHGTFCSTDPSAALLKLYFGGRSYLSTVQALATIFGSNHYSYFPPPDRQLMKKVFSRCHTANNGGATVQSRK
uniref:Putative secreted protein n=1 Tax=Amblyomma triste TaxID=251400 RepID=A0A023G5R1_AMBTT